MECENNKFPNVHMGRNVRKFRNWKGIKQSEFALMIGLKIQQDVSRLESQPVIKDDMLKKIALVLEVPEEILRTLPDDSGGIIIDNHDITIQTGAIGNIGMEVSEDSGNINNPIEQIVEIIKEKDRKEQERMEELENRIKELEELLRKK